MGKVLYCKGCGSGQQCCCTPAVVHEWTGCADLDHYFDQETNSLADLLGTCVPCGSGKANCGEAIGWRIVAFDTITGTGGCGQWDYANKTIEHGDILETGGQCYFQRCSPCSSGEVPQSGNNYFCPTGCCDDAPNTTFQLQFGCNDVWPDNKGGADTCPFSGDCITCSGSGDDGYSCSGKSGASCNADCSDLTATLTGTFPVDCDCFGNGISLTRTNCSWSGSESHDFMDGCFGTTMVSIGCINGKWTATVSATSMCDGLCDETWSGIITSVDGNGCPAAGAYDLEPENANCDATMTMTLV